MQYMIRRANYFYRGQVKRNLRYLSLSENRTMSSVESLPVLYIKASNHFDVGQAVGKTFKGFINDYMSDSKEVKMYRKFFNDPRGKPIVEQYLETSEKYHPDIMSEIRGIADGSGESFVDIFMLQLASEISMCHYDVLFPSEADSHSTPKGCTDVLVNRQSCRVIGHNEDWAFEVSSRVGIVHVTITGHGETKPMEQFLSYVFPGYLSGLTFGMNKHLVLTLNSLAPTQANVRGVPLQIVVRNLLTCDSISACVEMMASRPVGCGFGMNINIAEINTDKMCSVEVYSDKNGSSTDVHWAHDWVDGFYHHQNHYRRPREDMQAPVVAGSRIRYERVEEMTKEVPVAGVDDVRTILGDDKSERTPIYLTHSEKHSYKDGSTSATAIFDISNRVLHVYRANPRHSLPLASLPFITSLLKQLQVNDDTRRLQSIAMTGKVAIPFRTKTQQKPEEVLAIVRSTLAESTCNENVPYIQVEPRQLPLVKKLLVKSPLQVLKGRLQKLVSENGEAWTPDLETDLPTHWERHGDLALVPDTAFCLPIWSNIGGEVWHCVADSLSCTRLARKSRVLKDGFRRPSVTLLYGDNGWVKQVDNRIRYSYDITRCMFSAGNITEKLRVASFDCRGETLVDLYAGIGYFTLPFLMYTGVAHVYACEWNPDAVEALKQNLRLNKVQDSCTVLFGDNRKVCPVGVADRVNLGLIPSSRDGWPVACRALKPSTGGILHIHHNVNTMSRQVGVTNMGYVQDHTWEQLDNAGKHTKLKADDCCGHNINTRHRQVGLDTGKIEDKGVLLNLDDKGTHKLKCGNSLEEDDKVQLADERLCHHSACDSAALNGTCRCVLSSGNSLSYSDCQCNNHQPVQCKNTPDHACSGSKICHQLTATKNNHRQNNRQTNTTVHQNLEMKSKCTGKGIRVQNGRTKTYIDHDKNGPVDTFLREDKYAFQGNHRDENGTGHSDDGGEGSRSGEAWKGWAIETSGEIRALLEREHGGVWRSQVLHVEHVKQYAPHVHHLVLDLKCTPNTSGNNNSILK